ncbi:MAG: DUF2085 domain-containing protein [Chloroflexota bacterium]|jgi:uncharacterized membrane protein
MIVERFIYTLARRWLLFLNLAVALYVGLPMLAPMLMQAGLAGPARLIYTVYSPMCHQLASRSFFVFGDQVAYPREIAGSSLVPIEAYMPSLPEFAEASADPTRWSSFLMPARQFVGNQQMGYKMALCQRDITLYLGILIGGLVYGLLSRRMDIRPMPFWLFILIGLMPIALDGFSQLFSQFFVGTDIDALIRLFPLRESSPFLRSATGLLFGLSIVWLVYPRLDVQFAEMAESQARKLFIEATPAD